MIWHHFSSSAWCSLVQRCLAVALNLPWRAGGGWRQRCQSQDKRQKWEITQGIMLQPWALRKDWWGFSMRRSETAYKPLKDKTVKVGEMRVMERRGRQGSKTDGRKTEVRWYRQDQRGQGGRRKVSLDIKIKSRWMDIHGGGGGPQGGMAECHLFV